MEKIRLCADDLEDLTEVLMILQSTIPDDEMDDFNEDLATFCVDTLYIMSTIERQFIDDDDFNRTIRATTAMNFFRFCMLNRKLIKLVLSLEDRYGEVAKSLNGCD